MIELFRENEELRAKVKRLGTDLAELKKEKDNLNGNLSGSIIHLKARIAELEAELADTRKAFRVWLEAHGYHPDDVENRVMDEALRGGGNE